MKPSEYCKSIGLTSLKEMSKISNLTEQRLIDWWTENQQAFKCVARGCAAIKGGDEGNGVISVRECLQEIKRIIEDLKNENR